MGMDVETSPFITYPLAFAGAGESGADDAPQGGKSSNALPDIPSELPVLPLRNVTAYPSAIIPIRVGRPRSVQLVEDVVAGNRLMVVVTSRNPDLEEPGVDDIYRVGTVVMVHRFMKAPDNTVALIIQGLARVRINTFTSTEPYLKGQIVLLPETQEEGVEIEALRRTVLETFRRLVEMLPAIPQELVSMIVEAETPLQLAYRLATHLRFSDNEAAQRILEADRASDKLRQLLSVLNHEIEVTAIGQRIQNEAVSEIEKSQREYFLRQQLEAIRKELGETDEQQMEVEEFRRKIEAAGMPEEAHREALRELDRLSKIPMAAAEYGVIRTYLDWLVELPWQKETSDNLDLQHARQVLDEDHYDLEKIKERILEYLAVRQLKQQRREEFAALPEDKLRHLREGAILCFVGPPGTGKTSLGQSIARALGREFVRLSLGGMRDEAEIRGHRRTYVGALPGRIIQAIRRVGVRNPVFMLDEVDKLGMDFRGDPASALLEVLDPEQNTQFRDHYLDVPFDLSKVLFITTANWLDPIPAPLLDRMEVINLAGYTDIEKLHIARRYLVPRQIRDNALHADEISFTDGALRRIINEYTREAGVRNLERAIGDVCRKVATEIAAGRRTGRARITAARIPHYLGTPRYTDETYLRTTQPGVAVGLAWTPVGGQVMFIEATRMPGSKGLIITGKLGDVMRESAQAALSYVRANASQFGIPEDFFNNSDLHIHVPAGAVPKDGPSAGITMATALVSLLTGRRMRPDVGMTGEITLRGQVLPIGGVKEKVLAAHRFGLKTVILPKENAKDLEDVPADVRHAMNFVLVEQVADAIEQALEPGPAAEPSA